MQNAKGSAFDHAKNLARLRRELQGQVVDVINEVEDGSAEMKFPIL